jgi:hypothetical protein
MSLYFQRNFDVDTLGGQKNIKEKKPYCSNVTTQGLNIV